MNRAVIILSAVLCCASIATAEITLDGEITPYMTRDIVGSPLTFSKIAFTEYNPEEPSETNVDLWIVNPDGSELEKIFDGVVSKRVRFSPCGQFLAFKGQDGKHRIIDLVGNVLHEFAGGSRSENDFSWSPDLKYIFFGVYFDGVYKYNLGDSTKARIVASSHRTYDHNPVVSPDSAKIVYTHHEYENRYYIYTIDIDGGNRGLITNGIGTSYDEQLNLNWVDNEHFIFKIDPKDLVYYVNKGTHEVIEIDPAISFSKMKLSHNKETLSIFSGSSLYFIDTNQLPTGIVTPYNTGLYAQAFAWSYDTDSCYYAIRSSSTLLRIFDKNDNEYEFLNPEDLPEDIGNIVDIDWSYGQVQVGPLVTPLQPNPITWLQVPHAISTTAIAMQATTLSGGHSPYSYEFDFVDSPTGGSGGTDSGWNGNSYTDSGLRVNHQYQYQCRGKDDIGQTVDWSGVQSTYTEIESCTGVTFGAVTTTNIQAKSTHTPSGLTRGSSGLIIRNKTEGTDSGWKQDNSYWTSGSLLANKAYQFMAQSRNGDGATTPESSPATRYTLPAAPNVSCDRTPDTPYPPGTVFTFTNVAGWDEDGVNHYHYIFNNSSSTIPSGLDSTWSGGPLSLTPPEGSWYLHVMSHNPEQASGGMAHYGPYIVTSYLQPNPLTWLQAPHTISTAAIAMQAMALSGGYSPYSYEFDFVDSPTSGSGGTDSGWNGSSYTDSGLGVNHQYRYRCRGKDDLGQTVNWSSVQSTYTEIESCTGVTFGTVTTASIQVKFTNTPSGLTRGSSGLIILNKTEGTDSGWKQDNSYWTSSSLIANKAYQFTAQSRNGDGETTLESSPLTTKYTLPATPNVICDKDTSILYPLGTEFTFTNEAAWSEGGVNHYHYVFDNVDSTNPTVSDSSWSSGTLRKTPSEGNWYLHVMSHNLEHVCGDTVHCGPYIVGPTEVVSSDQDLENIPSSFELSQNFPNPFNANSQIRYGLPHSSFVVLRIYNTLGQFIKELVSEELSPGYHEVIWDGKDSYGIEVGSGIYFLHMESRNFSKTLKMLLVK